MYKTDKAHKPQTESYTQSNHLYALKPCQTLTTNDETQLYFGSILVARDSPSSILCLMFLLFCQTRHCLVISHILPHRPLVSLIYNTMSSHSYSTSIESPNLVISHLKRPVLGYLMFTVQYTDTQPILNLIIKHPYLYCSVLESYTCPSAIVPPLLGGNVY